MSAVDAAASAIAAARADIGATGNRLQGAISNLESSREALAVANSRIKDVNVAEETSRMSRAHVVSVLAQANQMPQLALKLLG